MGQSEGVQLFLQREDEDLVKASCMLPPLYGESVVYSLEQLRHWPEMRYRGMSGLFSLAWLRGSRSFFGQR